MSTLKLNYLLSPKNNITEYASYVRLSHNRVCATDALVLIKSTILDVFDNPLDEFSEWLLKNGPIYVHSDEWKKIANKKCLSISIREIDSKIFLEFNTGSTIIMVETIRDDIKYPNVDAVIPDDDAVNGVEMIGIDLSLLNRIYKSINIKRVSQKSKFNFDGPLSPIVITNDSLLETVILLMPFKL